MKYLALLMLMASYTVAAELPSINGDSSAASDSDHTDVILLMLQQIKGDVAQLNLKVDILQTTTDNLQATTDNLQATSDYLLATTDSLQTTVGVLSLKVRNIEDDVKDLTEFKNTVETETDLMDQTIQQQITDLSGNVAALTEENEEIQQQVVHLSNAVQANVTSLTNENAKTKQDVIDLSSKEQSDYDELDADIAALNSTIQDNYQELKDDIDALNTTAREHIFGANGYCYEWVDTLYTWDQARANCIDKGGDLAHHGFDSLSFRVQLICNYFNLCDDGTDSNGSPLIGLSREYSNTGRWEYLNGEYSPFDNQLWYKLTEYEEPDRSCGGLLGIEYNDPDFLQAYSMWCDAYTRTSICEFKC